LTYANAGKPLSHLSILYFSFVLNALKGQEESQIGINASPRKNQQKSLQDAAFLKQFTQTASEKRGFSRRGGLQKERV
jgi:hypothetical protein